MPLLILLVVALVVASVVAFVSWHYPVPMASPTPSLAAAKAVGRELGHHRRLRRTIMRRLNPKVATGLALTVALGVVVLGGITLGALAYLVRSNSQLVDLDASVAQWAADQTGPVSDRALEAITQLGATWLVVMLAFVVAVVGYLRRPSRWIPVFLFVVIVGERLLTNGIKDLLDRVRPTLNPIAETLGPSFPSGHATTAAAFYAARRWFSAAASAGTDARCWPASQRASPSPSRARAYSLTCTGSRTPSRGSFSAGPGLQPAPSRSAGVGSFALAPPPRRPCTRRTWSKAGS